jgi:hypothetical protein
MENRERDRVSQRTSPTEAGNMNRRTEEEKSQDTGSGVEFGRDIGRSENLDANPKGETMNRNKQQENMEHESSRSTGGESGYGSSTGRTSGSSGSMGRGSTSGSSDISEQRGSVGSKSGNLGSDKGSSDWSDRSDRS